MASKNKYIPSNNDLINSIRQVLGKRPLPHETDLSEKSTHAPMFYFRGDYFLRDKGGRLVILGMVQKTHPIK